MQLSLSVHCFLHWPKKVRFLRINLPILLPFFVEADEKKYDIQDFLQSADISVNSKPLDLPEESFNSDSRDPADSRSDNSECKHCK